MRRITLLFYIAFGLVFEPFCWLVMEVGYHAERMHIPFVVARADIGVLDRALSLYRQDVGGYPTAEQGLRALLENPSVPGWVGPYLRGSPRFARGGLPYVYRPRPQGKPEVLWLGVDGKIGGRGDDQDISNLRLDEPMLPSVGDYTSIAVKVLAIGLAPIAAIGYLCLPWIVRRRSFRMNS